MQNLRPQKRRAIKCDHGFSSFCHVARNDRNESLRRSWTAATATPDRRPSDQDEDNFSEDPLEQLNPFPFPGNVWVEGGALDPGAVFGRRFWVEHLERVAAARGAR